MNTLCICMRYDRFVAAFADIHIVVCIVIYSNLPQFLFINFISTELRCNLFLFLWKEIQNMKIIYCIYSIYPTEYGCIDFNFFFFFWFMYNVWFHRKFWKRKMQIIGNEIKFTSIIEKRIESSHRVKMKMK